jgi:hypothetical protein
MTLHGPNYEEPPLGLIKEQLEWEVEAILDFRRFGCTKKLQYRVRWKGYSIAHDSWESAQDVHAPELVGQYYKTKGSTAVKSISPTRINCLAMSNSPASSTPSYVEEIHNQFVANPLLDLPLLHDHKPFLVYPNEELEEPPTPPPITISPSPHASVVQELEREMTTLHDNNPGDRWELTRDAIHHH